MLNFQHLKIIKHDNKPNTVINLENSALSQVLSFSPNEFDTPIVFWAKVVRRMLKDKFAVVIPTYENGEISSINLADGVDSFDDGVLKILINNERYEVPLSNVWVFENPKENLSIQLNEITSLIDESLKALSYKLAHEQNSLKGIISFPTNVMDETMKEEAKKRVSEIMEVASTGGIGYLSRGEQFQELNNEYNTASPQELEFLKEQLFQAFGINEQLFTCNYTEAQYRAYLSSILKVYADVITQEINRKYFSKTARTQGQVLNSYFDIFQIASLKDLTDFAFKTKYSGILNSNEIREKFGYGGYEGGDIFETNKNAIQINSEIKE